MLVYRFGSFLLQVMLSALQVFAFERYDVYCELLAYLHSTFVIPGPAGGWRLAAELFASSLGRFLSRISYLPSFAA